MSEPTEYDREQDEVARRRAEEQASTDHRQDDEIRRQGRRLDEIDSFVLTPGEVAAQPSAHAPSSAQRLRIYVPNVATLLSMGAAAPSGAIRGQDWSEQNYAGFGVTTKGNVFVDAMGGNVDESRMRLQANGFIAINSDQSSVVVGATQNALLHAAQVSMVHGQEGVVLAGGYAISGAGAANPRSDAGTVPLPPWTQGTVDAVSAINAEWTRVDSVAAGIGIAATAASTAFDIWDRSATFLTLVQSGISAFLSGWGMLINAQGLNGNPGWAGTVVGGKNGLILGSGRAAGLYSAIGTTVASLASVGVVAPLVGIIGAANLDMKTLGSAGLLAAYKADLVGGKDATLAARRGKLQLLGRSINIGAEKPDGRAQLPTSDIGITAVTSAALRSRGTVQVVGDESATLTGKQRVVVTSDEMALVGANHVNLAGTVAAAISAGRRVYVGVGKAHFLATRNQAVIGVGEALPDPPRRAPYPPNPEAVLNGAHNARIRNIDRDYANALKEHSRKIEQAKASWTQVKLTDSKWEAHVKGSKLEGSSSGWKINGPVLKIGR